MKELRVKGYINVFEVDGKLRAGGIVYTQSGEATLIQDDHHVAKMARERVNHLPTYIDTVKVSFKVPIQTITKKVKAAAVMPKKKEEKK